MRIAECYRLSAKSLLSEQSYVEYDTLIFSCSSIDVIERHLAHAERNKVRASYNQAEYMEECRTRYGRYSDARLMYQSSYFEIT